ncbi:SMI1/KNR4 family protein [Vibrio crassostreae]|uniref:SMI1/KNR4 family protein n=1 Tax=Vibrio crassostreae TaxID=246167 RepID=UPI00104508CA|nr:SMI1/KNR4 family protein [Vibrio crassostreae]TCN94932.1 SUKH superfamily protein [Vibrio crassostreae]CAK1787581.1 SUKH superfamily protein [Vibrio crassostreae]CAK1818143.1 SUKH superfamily protein [Vibrio crassostreae]CAK1821327.1 SUKH superfamily protein [Vibrio crassostreae]CAK2606702.1 SUKH superfamily protein [Vibrio crassostreae]
MVKTITDAEIDEAQKMLGFEFPLEYIEFIKSGYDLGDAPIEALEISDPPSYADIFGALKDAREYDDLPAELLPICEDNSDYYCLNPWGEVVFWSHNGVTDEKWANVAEWRAQMIAESEA